MVPTSRRWWDPHPSLLNVASVPLLPVLCRAGLSFCPVTAGLNSPHLSPGFASGQRQPQACPRGLGLRSMGTCPPKSPCSPPALVARLAERSRQRESRFAGPALVGRDPRIPLDRPVSHPVFSGHPEPFTLFRVLLHAGRVAGVLRRADFGTAANRCHFLRTEFPFPKPDMISRLDGEEEPQNSDRWQLPGGSFAGTRTNPPAPLTGELCKGDSRFPRWLCGRVSEAGSRGTQVGAVEFQHLLSSAVWPWETSPTPLSPSSSSCCG